MQLSPRILESRIWEEPAFTFVKGCRICIHAESGSGKSSLLSFIFGSRSDYNGTIYFDKEDIRSFSIKKWCEIRKLAISLLPQELRLFNELTAIENILLKNNLTNYKTHKEIEEYFEILGIPDKMNQPASKLSIGQQQRVAIIRALCQPFDFIFLDEPVSHLDEDNNKTVASLIEREAQKTGAGIISTSVGNHLLITDPTFVKL